jgi:hypothetical protein
MPTLEISPATSFSFRIETGAGTIRDGETIDDNYLYEDVATFWDCEALQPVPYCQPFTCSQTVSFQFEYENGSQYPEVIITDAMDNYVISYTVTNVSGDLYEATVDMSDLDCGECYRVKIRSILTSPNGITLCAENGTFELPGGATGTATGGNNVISVQVGTPPTKVRSGTRSGLISANASPSAGSDTVLNCSTPPTLSADTYYVYRYYVYEEDGGSNFSNGGTYYVDISDYSDATLITETRATPSADGFDTWLLVEVVFLTGSDVTGNIYLKMTNDTDLPLGSGEVWVDDFSLSEDQGTPTVEATGQKMCVASSHSCHLTLTWTSDHDSSGQQTFGIDYSNSLVNTAMVQAEFYRVRFEDPDYVQDNDSLGQTFVQSSRPEKIKLLKTNWLPPYMLEKLMMALKHDTVTINGVQYALTDSEVNPNYADDNLVAGILELDMQKSDYDFENMSC